MIGQELLLEEDRVPVRTEYDAVEVLAAQGREKERAAEGSRLRRERRARGGPRFDAPAVDQRIAKTRVTRRATHGRPSVVAAGHDEVHLVVAAVGERIRRPVLGLVQGTGVGVPGDALYVAVPERPDRGAGRGIVGRDRPVSVQPQDFPGEDVWV